MDDILNIWNELDKDFTGQKIPGRAASQFNQEQSGLLLSRMKRNMRYGLYWNLFFIALLIAVSLFHLSDRHILILIGVMLLIYFFTLVFTGRYYLKISGERIMEENAKAMLVSYYTNVVKMLRFERITSLFFIPTSLIAGLLYSLLLKYGTFGEIMLNQRTALITGLLMVTAVPLTLLWVSWAQKYAFKNDLRELKNEIEILSGDEAAN